MRALVLIAVMALMALPAVAQDQNPHEWFAAQKMPHSNAPCGYLAGTSCCNESDGRVTSVRPGTTTPLAAWVREIGDWVDIPRETLIPDSENPMPGAVLWWTARCGILCFADRTGG